MQNHCNQPILKKNLSSEKLEKLIVSEFTDIQPILLNKNWKTTLSFKNDSIVFDIAIPSLQQNSKINKVKSKL